jgi:hypothetical protein
MEEGEASNKVNSKPASRGKKRITAEKEAEYLQPAVNGDDAPPPPPKR